ncbi:hypothetical protein OIE64_07675 [Streptomyces brevispora]|uniref:Uncharacterized protein n=1 Tax=Streptomyces brevispora TaxID=887462 RepID=A0A561V3X7_9ACTN|nr:hypothetical protein [Streptomyces brevispora]TWG06321.1 hypothetical protein FHX80_114816 [Streptomyces brevispora]WSC12728.1 hypothetical protein OIE64_07675 [Streptomyces brevispora]
MQAKETVFADLMQGRTQQFQVPLYQRTYSWLRLEYRCMIIAGVSEGLVPRSAVNTCERTDRLHHRRELRCARSLLFVAATRARDALTTS